LRSKISGEQAKLEITKESEAYSSRSNNRGNNNVRRPQFTKPAPRMAQRPAPAPRPQFTRKTFVNPEQKQKFKEMLENMIGTRGAQVLDQKLNTLGKVPISELATTIGSLNNTAYAVIFDGIIDRDLAKAAESANVKFLVGMDSKVKPNESRVCVLTVKEL